MAQLRFTKRSVEAIPFPKKGQNFYRDEEMRGLGLRVGAKSKVYIAEGQFNRRTKRVTIGRSDLYAPEIARKKARSILAELAEGNDPNALTVAPTLREAFEEFLKEKPSLAKATKDAYTRTYRLYLKDWSGRKLDEITKQDVSNRHRKLERQNGGTTANVTFRYFRSVYNFISAKIETMPPNPVAILSQTRAWHPEKRRQTVIGVKALGAWWNALQDDTEDARDILLLALFTGMRRSEVLGLRWGDLDFAERSLEISNTKNGDPLRLPLSPYLARMLENRRELVGQSEWVFPGVGATGHITETKTITARVSKSSGVTFTMHDLRRTFITIAESLDIPHYALKRLLNHRIDGDVTGGYIVFDVERLRGPVDRIAERILELAQVDNFR